MLFPQLSDSPHLHPFNFGVTTLVEISHFSSVPPRVTPLGRYYSCCMFLTLGNPENKTKKPESLEIFLTLQTWI